MDSIFILMLIPMLLIGIGLNLVIHLYYRNKHRQFILDLQDTDYTLFKDVPVDLDFTTKLSLKYRFTVSDVVFTASTIFILQKNKYVRQCMPIIAFTNSYSRPGFSNIALSYVFNECYVKNKYLIVSSSKDDLLKFKAKAQIKITDTADIGNILAKYDLNPQS
jgi:hypothetical protein